MKQIVVPELDHFLREKVDKELQNYPSLMSANEKMLLYTLAAKVYTGEGYIVDGGVYLGGSTFSLAKGLADNIRVKLPDGKTIHSYDRFQVQESLIKHLQRSSTLAKIGDVALEKGDDFLPVVQELTKEYSEYIEFHPGDILDAEVPGPIEIAYWHVLKNAEIDASVFDKFVPHFISGKTIIVFQEYFFEGLPFVKIRQEYFADYFEFLGESGAAAVFRFKKALPKRAFSGDPIAKLSSYERCALIDQAAARTVVPDRKLLVELSKIPIITKEQGQREAVRALEDIETRYHRQILDAALPGSGESHLLRAWRKIAQKVRAEVAA
ncbi:hypothetical protein [Sphingomonas hengshuiensis]|uniref:Uncharacterized protein n=1 Tax=Sphingomonas hengshuiensis TaxID=1609977 RepID=A0A7U5HVH6_9SPHN|nr:hypothetical protein [Sphingomonas hengshuiensis]AJP70606.1 hypothetical protein TS85_00335 [Sphingomonas hengshuiensis]